MRVSSAFLGTTRADQKEFLQKAVQVAQKVPGGKADEEDPYWKNCWHWSLS